MKWLKKRKSRENWKPEKLRGPSVEYLVPEMLQYVKERYIPPEPIVRYSIGPVRPSVSKYNLPKQPREEKKPVIEDMKTFKQEAEKDMALYDSPALENTYHAWERDHSEYKSFSSEVVRMVGERFEKTSDFYRAANIDKRVYHKIRSDFSYRPSRQTAFRCCFGLGLNLEEAEALLKLAGMAFSPNNPDDLVIKFCLEKGITDIPGINYMLWRYTGSTLADRGK